MNEKAVAIAQDVIDRLESKKLKPTKGYYISGCLRDMADLAEQAQPFIDEIEGTCSVCTLGACLLSYIRLFNETKLNEIIQKRWDGIRQLNMPETQDVIRHKLLNIFGAEQLALIEIAYEKLYSYEHGYAVCRTENLEASQRAFDFGSQYQKIEDRMMAIMKNVVENGFFKP